MTWLEYRVLAVAAATAALAAGAIILAVEIAAPSSAEPAAKEIVTTVATALVAFVASVTVKEDDVDSAIGDFIKDRFEAAYPAASAAATRDRLSRLKKWHRNNSRTFWPGVT